MRIKEDPRNVTDFDSKETRLITLISLSWQMEYCSEREKRSHNKTSFS